MNSIPLSFCVVVVVFLMLSYTLSPGYTQCMQCPLHPNMKAYPMVNINLKPGSATHYEI